MDCTCKVFIHICADVYSAQRTVAHRELDLFSSYLKDGSAILDVGCGSGVPVTLRLPSRFSLTGVDISDRMIKLAKAKVSNAEFIRANILEVDFAESSFRAWSLHMTCHRSTISNQEGFLALIRSF